MRYYLSKISIEGFRGIQNEGAPLEIKFMTDCVNSIYASNGFGKTSVFEAIQYAIFGTLPRLKDLESYEKGDSFYANKFHSLGVSTIILELQPDDGSAKIAVQVVRAPNGSKTVTSPTGHPKPEELLKSLQEDFTLIDYKRFAKFIDDSALQRGRSFSSLLGLSKFAKLRQAVHKVSETRSLDNALQSSFLASTLYSKEGLFAAASTKIKENFKKLTKLDVTDLDDQPTIVSQATEALKQVAIMTPLIGTGTIMDLKFKDCKDAIAKEEGGEDKKTYILLTPRITSLDEIAPALNEVEEKQELLNLVKLCDTAVAEVGGPNLQGLFNSAASIIGTPEWPRDTHCEVCGSDTPYSIKEHLHASIAKYENLEIRSTNLSTYITNSEWLKRLRKLEASKELKLEDTEKVAHTIDNLCKSHKFNEERLAEFVKHQEALETKRLAILKELNEIKTELEKKLPPSLVALTSQIEAAEALKEALKSYTTLRTEIKLLRRQNAIRERWKSFIKMATLEIGKAESALATNKITEIEATYQDFFKTIMRGAPNLKPKLVRPSAAENIQLNLEDFHGVSGISARAVLSESYRNAVAASIFLASALKHTGLPRFMILDDITSSFDNGHQTNLMDLIRTQIQKSSTVDGIQIILLSHDGYIEKYCNRMVSEGLNWRHQKLLGTSPKGILRTHQQQVDNLKVLAQTYLNDGQIEAGQGLVRQYLEFKLDQIINKLQIPVPPIYATNGDKRMVSNSLEVIEAAIDIYQKAGILVMQPTQITQFKNNYVPAIISNWVSHYESATTMPVTNTVLLGVLDSIDDLSECFRYNDTNNTPVQRKWYKTLSQI